MQRRVGVRGLGSIGVMSVVLGGAVAFGGAGWIARNALEAQRAGFETDARIVHRLLSQRAVQHDAILATLALLQPAAQAGGGVEQRLPALYAQLLRVLRRDPGAAWPAADAREAAALAAAELASRQQQRAALGDVDFTQGRYWLVRAAEPASFALQIDARALVEPEEWPLPAASPVRAALLHEGAQLVLHEGQLADGRWRFDFAKRLAADSQPFDVTLAAGVGTGALPWRAIALWLAACAALAAAASLAWRHREQARRARERSRLDQVSRLNAMGELAAGIAHELNQPLTAVLANTGAAARLLADDEPDLATARGAMAQASAQAQRAGNVLARLRRLIERPDSGAALQAVPLAPLLASAVDLLDAEWRALDLRPRIDVVPAELAVQADSVALQQIVHNLLGNAQQALAQVPAAERQLVVEARVAGPRVALTVRDSGCGIAPEALPHLFEPFFSTRRGGLGLGLSLSESLALGMGGALTAAHAEPRGAVLRLELARA